jgi:hypothetical protein
LFDDNGYGEIREGKRLRNVRERDEISLNCKTGE